LQGLAVSENVVQFGKGGFMKRKNARDDLAIKLILSLEDSSEWLCKLVAAGCERDLDDVILDLELALIAFKSARNRDPRNPKTTLQ
jgi:hypothetical protein